MPLRGETIGGLWDAIVAANGPRDALVSRVQGIRWTYAELTAEELIAFSRETLPGFKAPSEIEFCELPKTSTGKVKKYELRARAREHTRS